MKSELGKILKAVLFLNIYGFVIFIVFFIYECLKGGLALNELALLITSRGDILISGFIDVLLALNIAIVPIFIFVVLYVKLFPNKPENTRKFMDIINKKSVVDAKDAQHN
ncbi:MAG: hypothetical protein KUG78_09480 [Kangiellaceae bacterium]|nr:hypothetical protein [Kangiellaceae bacterium]